MILAQNPERHSILDSRMSQMHIYNNQMAINSCQVESHGTNNGSFTRIMFIRIVNTQQQKVGRR